MTATSCRVTVCVGGGLLSCVVARTGAAGRSWKASELRLKSFDDLHKLWFVLLKERNVLLADRLYHKQANMAQPDPSRLQKVRACCAVCSPVMVCDYPRGVRRGHAGVTPWWGVLPCNTCWR